MIAGESGMSEEEEAIAPAPERETLSKEICVEDIKLPSWTLEIEKLELCGRSRSCAVVVVVVVVVSAVVGK